MQKPTIILDANAFITGENLLELGAKFNLCTTSSVLDQIRDQKTRKIIDNFPFKIQKLNHNKKTLDIMRDFAKKTGDLGSLSDVDLEVIAVAYQLYLDKGLGAEIRTKPLEMKEWVIKDSFDDNALSSSDQQIVEEEAEQEDKQQSTQQQPKQDTQQQDKQQKESDDGWIIVSKKQKRKQSSSQDSMDEDEGWVTPQNYEVKMSEVNTKVEDEQQSQKMISVMTADYAMQNVLTQMSIPLLSLDGRKIKEIRRFIHQCYLCWKRYKIQDNKIRLCKQCGYNTLSKIAYSINQRGQMILHRKKGWKPNQKVLEWKQKKYQEQQRKRKHQNARRKKQQSIFDNY